IWSNIDVRAVCALVCLGAVLTPCLAADTPEKKDISTACRPMVSRLGPLGREFLAELAGTTNPVARVKKPPTIPKTVWGGQESSGALKLHRPVRITLHHEGSAKPLTTSDDPKRLLRNLQNWGFRVKGWPDIPYHFLIDLNGNIYEARNLWAVGDTNTQYDPTGHVLVTLMGNYELQTPTPKQLESLCDFLAWLCDHYNIDPATIACHREYAQTACPGKYFTPYVLSGHIEAEVRKRIKAAYGVREK
ncbi:MAG: peptidoglycan recognition protein family protein, partial [Candidatus Sumerlaeaceae bacterium]